MIVVIFGPPACGKSRLISLLASEFTEAAVIQIDSMITEELPSKKEFDLSQKQFLHTIEQS